MDMGVWGLSRVEGLGFRVSGVSPLFQGPHLPSLTGTFVVTQRLNLTQQRHSKAGQADPRAESRASTRRAWRGCISLLLMRLALYFGSGGRKRG